MKAFHVEKDPIVIKTRERLYDGLVGTRHKMIMACGGKGLCATCHVYVVQGAEKLSPITPREKSSLAMVANVRPNSRLACQAKVLGDGVQIQLPDGKFIAASSDLDELVGRKADQAILHPITGAILIEAGKLITRSRIQQLSIVDVDVQELRAQTHTR